MEQRLAECIAVSVDPLASPEQRRQAIEYFNQIKELPGNLATVSNLCKPSNSDQVRHGALVLFEHYIRVYWNDFPPDQRHHLKIQSIELIKNLKPINQEAPHVKQGVCRVAVEIAKREWPQNWPDFLTSLVSLTSFGMTQTELVLLILLRIAEDVVHLKALEDAPRRRKEIYQGLLENIPNLFRFFFTTLNNFYTITTQNNAELECRSKLLKSLLTTLTCYVEFVQPREFLIDEVLKALCCLLNDSELRIQSATCLREIAERKCRDEELEILCSRFLRPEIMSEILRSVARSLETDSRENHGFLISLCEALNGICRQLYLYIIEAKKFECPTVFVDLVMAVVRLCQHPSCVIGRIALSAMASLTKIQLKKNPKVVFPQCLWENIIQMILQRLSIGSSEDYTSVTTQWDCDDPEDLKQTHTRFKADLGELLRNAVCVEPYVVFKTALIRLSQLLQRESTEEEWQATSRFLEISCSTVSKENIDLAPLMQQFFEAFDHLLNLKMTNINIQSQVMSCCSSLLSFVVSRDNDERLLKMLDTVFSVAAFERPGDTRSTRSAEVREFRKHGTSLLVRMCIDHTTKLFKYFDKIKVLAIRNLANDEVSILERQHYLEALTILSNEFTDQNQQYNLLKEMLQTDILYFCSDPKFRRAITDVRLFVEFLGLHSDIEFDKHCDERVNLSGKIMTITGVVKRCKKRDHEPNAAYDIVVNNCLVDLLKVLWLFKQTFTADNLHPSIRQSIVCLGEGDKFNLFGYNTPSCDFPVPLIPGAQCFYNNLQDCLSAFIVTMSFSPQFYTARPDLGHIVMSGLGTMTSYKMRQYFHFMIRPFCRNCPDDMLLAQVSPTFIPLMTLIYGKLETNWQGFRKRKESSEETEATLDELIEDQVTHQFSRDLIEYLGSILVDEKTPVSNDEMGTDSIHSMKAFGLQLLMDPNAALCAITTLFSALTWADSQTCYKAIPLCCSIAHNLKRINRLTPELSMLMYRSYLLSLRVHGDNEAQIPLLLTLGVYLYRVLGTAVPLQDLLSSVGCRADRISKFEEMLAPGAPVAIRKRKDAFRHVVDHLIGTSVSSKGRQSVQIRDLQPVWKMPKPEKETEPVSLVSLFGCS